MEGLPERLTAIVEADHGQLVVGAQPIDARSSASAPAAGGPAIEPEMSTTNTVRVGRPASPFPHRRCQEEAAGGLPSSRSSTNSVPWGVLFRRPPGRDHVAIGGDLPGRGGEALEPQPAGRRDEVGNAGSGAKRIATEAVGNAG